MELWLSPVSCWHCVEDVKEHRLAFWESQCQMAEMVKVSPDLSRAKTWTMESSQLNTLYWSILYHYTIRTVQQSPHLQFRMPQSFANTHGLAHYHVVLRLHDTTLIGQRFWSVWSSKRRCCCLGKSCEVWLCPVLPLVLSQSCTSREAAGIFCSFLVWANWNHW